MDTTGLNAVVTLCNQVSPWLRILQVVPDGGVLPDYVPGQFLSLGLFGAASRCALAEPEKAPADPQKLIRRAYSIASSPANREFLEFYIALVPGGALSPRLFNLEIGDRIWLAAEGSRPVHVRRFEGAAWIESGPDLHQLGPGALREHARHASET